MYVLVRDSVDSNADLQFLDSHGKVADLCGQCSLLGRLNDRQFLVADSQNWIRAYDLRTGKSRLVVRAPPEVRLELARVTSLRAASLVLLRGSVGGAGSKRDPVLVVVHVPTEGEPSVRYVGVQGGEFVGSVTTDEAFEFAL